MNALVIDDSRVMRLLLRNLLTGAGFTVRDAAGGPAALRDLETAPTPDLFLVDWNMPDMTGLELVREIRRQPRFVASRILMITTETSATRMTEALTEGADEYLMKPFVNEALLDKLRLLRLLEPTPTPDAPDLT